MAAPLPTISDAVKDGVGQKLQGKEKGLAVTPSKATFNSEILPKLDEMGATTSGRNCREYRKPFEIMATAALLPSLLEEELDGYHIYGLNSWDGVEDRNLPVGAGQNMELVQRIEDKNEKKQAHLNLKLMSITRAHNSPHVTQLTKHHIKQPNQHKNHCQLRIPFGHDKKTSL